MSNRSLMGQVRDLARHARNIKHLTDPKAIGEYCHAECKKLGMITAEWTHQLQVQAMIGLATIRVKQSGAPEAVTQMRLFDNYEDIVFDIRHEDGVVQKALGDFNRLDISQIFEQQDANIASAVAARDLFERASKTIVPLLQDHPDWLWRDAVEYLRRNGTLPTL
jgi:hypothetical protein